MHDNQNSTPLTFSRLCAWLHIRWQIYNYHLNLHFHTSLDNVSALEHLKYLTHIAETPDTSPQTQLNYYIHETGIALTKKATFLHPKEH